MSVGARDGDAQTFCPEKISECDLVIYLIGLCFGSSPPDSEKSFTELEYEHAKNIGVPCLVFLSADNYYGYPGYYPDKDAEGEKQLAFDPT